MTTSATTGSKCVLKRGNADSATTAVRSSRSMGSSNSTLVIYWGTPGTAGDVKTCSVVVSGTNTALSVTVTTSAVTINSATNGGGSATSTVNQIIAALYANSTFLANWDARTGAGDGTGTIAAASSSSLSGGVDGETFSSIAEVKGFRGPSLSGGVVDVTSFDSSQIREFIATIRDSGTASFSVNYLPNGSGTGHQLLITDLYEGTTKNFVFQFSDTRTTEMTFSGIVTGAEITAELEQALQANISVKVTGWPSWF